MLGDEHVKVGVWFLQESNSASNMYPSSQDDASSSKKARIRGEVQVRAGK